MAKDKYTVFSEADEDIFGFTSTLDEAEKLADRLLTNGTVEGPLLVEFDGLVIRQYALRPGGMIEETVAATLTAGNAKRQAG